jgi:hypothetical protein
VAGPERWLRLFITSLRAIRRASKRFIQPKPNDRRGPKATFWCHDSRVECWDGPETARKEPMMAVHAKPGQPVKAGQVLFGIATPVV